MINISKGEKYFDMEINGFNYESVFPIEIYNLEITDNCTNPDLDSEGNNDVSVLNVEVTAKCGTRVKFMVRLLGNEGPEFLNELQEIGKRFESMDIVSLEKLVSYTGLESMIREEEVQYVYSPFTSYIELMTCETELTSLTGYLLATEAFINSFLGTELRNMYIEMGTNSKGQLVFNTLTTLDGSSNLVKIYKDEITGEVELEILEDTLSPLKEIELAMGTVTSVAIAASMGVIDITSILPNPLILLNAMRN